MLDLGLLPQPAKHLGKLRMLNSVNSHGKPCDFILLPCKASPRHAITCRLSQFHAHRPEQDSKAQ